eukprot:TRINITY_DN26_c0_g1_i1.p1 TRINITY_DN26_c0_g1~~TRINITY_DN26_c0_g1_i1.p1  ORF type:complete len:140 (-),score=33.75 TRINITY_DN26_c0_g1_i1:676-1095(-)
MSTAASTVTSSATTATTATTELKVIEEDKALEQCGGDATFLTELLEEVLKDKEKIVKELSAAMDKNDHKAFSETAHSVKGAALNLYLPGLSTVAKTAEFCGKALMADPKKTDELNQRSGLIKKLVDEYARLDSYLHKKQ